MKYGRFKMKLHMELRDQLHELVNTTDRPLQQKYLNNVYDWYYNKKSKMGQQSMNYSRPDTGISGGFSGATRIQSG